ncbi:MAG: carboxypeptidase-like regulatory domain-containing protein [Candidatus Brocadiia bacterium]
MPRGLAAALALAAFVALASPAQGHKLTVFATAEGRIIRGRVYYSLSQPAAGADIRVTGPEGELLWSGEADDDGEFQFRASRRCDHTITAESADGHRDACTIQARDLAPKMGDPPQSPSPTPQARETPEPEARPQGEAMAQDEALDDDLAAAIEQAVARQVRPLRQQLEAHDQRRRLHDILGGLGYIAGLTGIVFYFLGVRRRRGQRPPSG